MLIILDMDFTLVDTTEPERLRRLRDWNGAYAILDNTTVYSGIQVMLNNLREEGHELVILTNSPGKDARRLVEIHELGIEEVYYYKDLGAPPKPNPSGHRILIQKKGGVPTQTVSVGDKATDRQAAQGAGAHFIAAMWGVTDRTVADGTDFVAEQPADVLEYIHQLAS
jgi:phosphoglycolate phosphatase-like HAD superfamily hydrolase